MTYIHLRKEYNISENVSVKVSDTKNIIGKIVDTTVHDISNRIYLVEVKVKNSKKKFWIKNENITKILN